MKLFMLIITAFLCMVLKPAVSRRIVRQANATGTASQQTAPTVGQQAVCNEGDTIVQQSVYKYKCVSGFPKLVSCIGSRRANNAELQVNETRTIDGFWYKCYEESGRARYAEEPRCLIGDKAVHVNETAVIGNLVFLCHPNGIQITGCVFADENGKLIQTKVGESAQVGNVRHICQGFSGPNGAGINQQTGASTPADVTCIYDGRQHKNNETWTAKSFRYLCRNGDVIITACVIDENNELPVGQTVAKFGLLHRCTKQGSRVSYRSEICGVGNVVCDASTNSNNSAIVNTQAPPRSNNGGVLENGTANGCIKDGEAHPAGSTWTAHNFKYSCHNDGSVSIDACVTDSNKEIGIGETWVLGGLQHICSSRPNGAVYSSQLCGAQVKCGPEGLQGSPASALPRSP